MAATSAPPAPTPVRVAPWKTCVQTKNPSTHSFRHDSYLTRMPVRDRLLSVPKVSLEQRRLEALRRQLQGKKAEPREREVSSKSGSFNLSQSSVTPTISQPILEDTTYLKHDLTRILILSTLAIAFQLCLYLASIKHILNFL